MNGVMANAGADKTYQCSETGGIVDCSSEHQMRNYHKSEMVLNLGSKTDTFISDQTPTPIRLIQKCEEMGLFQDLQTENPFEETFRKAAENIRSGSTSLEVSRLTVPNNSDDSLHTPHIIFPKEPVPNKIKRVLSPCDDSTMPIIQDIPLEPEESNRIVVQQEADTSEETQVLDLNVSGSSEETPLGSIQFLLQMPNGKMVQLSSLPVEETVKDIPVIKVDSSFLKKASEEGQQGNSSPKLGVHLQARSASIISSSNSHVGSADKMEMNYHPSNKTPNSINNTENKDNREQLSKISLAKLKLKQALMNNTCPAANASSSTISFSSNGTISSIANAVSQSQTIRVRRPSSTSDEGGRDDLSHDVSSAEEKRRRNRAAAMRCREKRKTWVKELERRANEMLRTNGLLQYEVSLLRDEVAQLKTLLLAHRDCPVTQALVEGKATLPSPLETSSSSQAPSAKRSVNKSQKSSTSAIVIQTSTGGNTRKPVILLNDPPAKRKRLSSSTQSAVSVSSSPAAVSIVTSSPQSSAVRTLVVPPKNSAILNPSFVNVIPSVLVANPTSSSSVTISGTPQVLYSRILPCLPPLAPNFNQVSQKQPYILPKSSANIVTSEKTVSNRHAKSEAKLSNNRTNHLLSTNVIKVNPNVMDCDDSDVEILDVKPRCQSGSL